MLHVVHDCGLGFNESVGEKALLVNGSVVVFFKVNFRVCVRAMCLWHLVDRCVDTPLSLHVW